MSHHEAMLSRLFLFSLSLLLLGAQVFSAQVLHPGTEESPFAPGATTIFPLHRITNCEKENETIDLGRVRVHVGEGIELSGTNVRGGHWSTSVDYLSIAGCGVYEADLDGNGTMDYVIADLSFNSSGPYCSELVLLLMDPEGNPSPWTMTGRLNADEQGIQQLFADEQGRLLVMHDFIMGHVAERGISEGFELYRVSDGSIAAIKGRALGRDWPYLPAANPENVTLRKTIAKNHLDVDLAPPTGSAIKVLDYAQNPHPKPPASSAMPVNPMHYKVVIFDSESYLHLADGTALRRPVVLVLQKGQDRTILFHVDETKLKQLVSDGISVQRVGTSCDDGDGCLPFILWANAEK